MDNIQKFLLESGRGFAFVGREYRLVVGDTEQFIDMLFYNIQKHCYVVIEIKTRAFDPRDMGQLGTYSAVNVPVGISEYELNNLIPDAYKSSDSNASFSFIICLSKGLKLNP